MRDKIKEIVSTLRRLYPELQIGLIIDDLEGQLESLGIRVLYSDMNDLESERTVSGFARANNKTGEPEIVLNGREKRYRQRFTMAHELGHLIMHKKWLPGIETSLDPKFANVTYRSDLNIYTAAEQNEEQQANEFAAELLLPLSHVKDIIEGSEENDTVLMHHLSDRYNVSLAMASIQMEKARRDHG